jgi:hypothetical protein
VAFDEGGAGGGEDEEGLDHDCLIFS